MLSRKSVAVTLVAAILFLFNHFFPEQTQVIADLLKNNTESLESHLPNASQADYAELKRIIQKQQSEYWTDSLPYKVVKILPDDNKGSRHQRFLVKAYDESMPTILVAHNIDLSPRVPLDLGDEILIRGRYEYNEKGGVLHWTHHDPNGYIKGGWIMHNGKRYQ